MADRNAWNDIYQLPKEDLLDLIVDYDDYIQEANNEDKFHSGWRPVSIAEFYEVEHRILAEERSREANQTAFSSVRQDTSYGKDVTYE